jgi:hypothetical protein
LIGRLHGDFGKLEFLKYDVTNLAYYIRHAGRAAVIGVARLGQPDRFSPWGMAEMLRVGEIG